MSGSASAAIWPRAGTVSCESPARQASTAQRVFLCLVQDTRRLLQSEATALSAEIKRRQTAARLEADRHTAAQMGLGDLGRLGERLAGAGPIQLLLWTATPHIGEVL